MFREGHFWMTLHLWLAGRRAKWVDEGYLMGTLGGGV